MIDWPENLVPLPSFNFNVDVEFSNVRSKMDSGRVRQRPRFTRPLELVKVRFELNQQQYAYFKAIYQYSLNQGNDWFNMRLPVPNNGDLTLSEVRFVSDFKANHRAVGNWTITATLEFKKADSYSGNVIAVIISEGGTDVDAFVAAANHVESEVTHFFASHSFQ